MFFAASLLGSSQVAYAFTLGDSANFSVLYEGGGVNHLNFNNGTITGNIGIGDPTGTNTAILAINGPATLNGDALFGGATNYTINGVVTINGTISGNHTNVQGDLNYLNTLSTTLGAETGSNVTFNISNGATQTVNATLTAKYSKYVQMTATGFPAPSTTANIEFIEPRFLFLCCMKFLSLQKLYTPQIESLQVDSFRFTDAAVSPRWEPDRPAGHL